MFAHVRVGLIAALVTIASIALSSIPANAADKPFQRSDLAEARSSWKRRSRAMPAPSQSRSRSCAATPTPHFRRTMSAPACSSRPDRCAGAERRRDVAAPVARHPADPRRNDRERSACSSAPRPPPTSPISAPATPARKPTASSLLGRTLRATASCGGRRSMRCGSRSSCARSPTCAQHYEQLREEHGFRMLDYSRRCRRGLAARLLPVLRRAAGQAHRLLAVRRGRRHRQAGALGRRKAALRRRAQARRALQRSRLRAGPAVDGARRRCRSRPTSTIYVRDRKPFARFAGKAYVLPRTGQRGIPVVSVNTAAVDDRDLSHRRPQPDRHRARRAISSATSTAIELEQLGRRARRSGLEGRAEVEQTLNADVTTAFPVDQAVGDLAPGVYVMTAEPKGADADDLRPAGDAMVHRLRPRPHRLFGQ